MILRKKFVTYIIYFLKFMMIIKINFSCLRVKKLTLIKFLKKEKIQNKTLLKLDLISINIEVLQVFTKENCLKYMGP